MAAADRQVVTNPLEGCRGDDADRLQEGETGVAVPFACDAREGHRLEATEVQQHVRLAAHRGRGRLVEPAGEYREGAEHRPVLGRDEAEGRLDDGREGRMPAVIVIVGERQPTFFEPPADRLRAEHSRP